MLLAAAAGGRAAAKTPASKRAKAGTSGFGGRDATLPLAPVAATLENASLPQTVVLHVAAAEVMKLAAAACSKASKTPATTRSKGVVSGGQDCTMPLAPAAATAASNAEARQHEPDAFHALLPDLTMHSAPAADGKAAKTVVTRLSKGGASGSVAAAAAGAASDESIALQEPDVFHALMPDFTIQLARAAGSGAAASNITKRSKRGASGGRDATMRLGSAAASKENNSRHAAPFQALMPDLTIQLAAGGKGRISGGRAANVPLSAAASKENSSEQEDGGLHALTPDLTIQLGPAASGKAGKRKVRSTRGSLTGFTDFGGRDAAIPLATAAEGNGNRIQHESFVFQSLLPDLRMQLASAVGGKAAKTPAGELSGDGSPASAMGALRQDATVALAAAWAAAGLEAQAPANCRLSPASVAMERRKSVRFSLLPVGAPLTLTHGLLPAVEPLTHSSACTLRVFFLP